jgi:hypothetical protein
MTNDLVRRHDLEAKRQPKTSESAEVLIVTRLWLGHQPGKQVRPMIEEVGPMQWLVVWSRHCNHIDGSIVNEQNYTYEGVNVKLLKVVPSSAPNWKIEFETEGAGSTTRSINVTIPPEVRRLYVLHRRKEKPEPHHHTVSALAG